MKHLIAALALVAAVGTLTSCQDDHLQRDCQDQRGYWDDYHGTCIFPAGPRNPHPTVTVTRTLSNDR